MLEPAYLVFISEERVSSFEAVREMTSRLKPFCASWMAYSFPNPSEAPVITAQVPFLPYLRSWDTN
jgi:hypothetical protein